jgi:fructose-bisphosphate aldolase class 1
MLAWLAGKKPVVPEVIYRGLINGTPGFVTKEAGIIPGIKLDTGASDMALHPGEKITEGLDGPPALEIWGGEEKNVPAAQEALYHRANCNRMARRGEYSAAMETA